MAFVDSFLSPLPVNFFFKKKMLVGLGPLVQPWVDLIKLGMPEAEVVIRPEHQVAPGTRVQTPVET